MRPDALFDRLDAWRHLPAWQLERRADLFFGLVLPEVLADTFGCAVHPVLVPELPLRKHVLKAQARPDLSSVNVDYFAMAADGSRGFLVELKTDVRSRNDDQDAYLQDARKAGIPGLMGGVVDIVRGPKARDRHRDRKYAWLVHTLEQLGCLAAPAAYRRLVFAEHRVGLTRAIDGITVTAPAVPLEVVYVQPVATTHSPATATTIDFARVARVVDAAGDPMSRRFAQSLRAWTQPPAWAAPA